MLVTIYKLKASNGKCYVGRTTNFIKRKSVSKKHSIDGIKSPIYNAIRKYGWKNFKKEVIGRVPCSLADGYEYIYQI